MSATPGNTGVTVSVPEWNFSLASNVNISIDDTVSIFTEAFVYMKLDDFNAMFTLNEPAGENGGVEGTGTVTFSSVAGEKLRDALIKQSYIANINTNYANSASISDSFMVEESPLKIPKLNLFEHTLLRNSNEQFGSTNSYIAFTPTSRELLLTESIGMGKFAMDAILSNLTNDIAQRIYLGVISERFRDRSDITGTYGHPFMEGDRITFSITYVPSSANKQFIEQVYRCIIEINTLKALNTTNRINPYFIHASSNLRVASDAQYTNAYSIVDCANYLTDTFQLDSTLINGSNIKNKP